MKKKLLVIVVLLFALSNLYSQSSSGTGNNKSNGGDVSLPSAGIYSPAFELVTNSSENTRYKKFFQKYGNWTFLLDRQTGVIHRAFGKGIKLPGLETINKKNIEIASVGFLKENAGIFDIAPASLKLQRITEINGHWYVSYKQFYHGLEVVLSEIELRIYKNGKLSNFGMIYYPVESINLKPNLTAAEAKMFAKIGIPFNEATDIARTYDNLFILPYTRKGETEYRLVYKVDIKTNNPLAHYFAYVDAYNGKVLWRQNMVMNAEKLTVQGLIKERFANDTFVVKPFAGQHINIDGNQRRADKNGEVELNLNDTARLNAQFVSDWVKIKMRRGQASADYSTKIPPSEDFNILWNDEISHKTERILFYHANFMHNYVRILDTALKQMDFQLQITIDFGGSSPNAFSNGSSIGFIGVGQQSMRVAESPQVLYHEYGHSVNQFIYESQGKQDGMVNISCNEGHADLFSTMIQDEPRMGVGVWVNEPDKIIRTLENTLVYPDDVEADGHHNGQILGGAFWDLRKMTSLDYVRRLSHFTKYGTPDDPDVGKAFSEWFIETLNTDDDDGDLSNGTPNIVNIVKAFNLHQIGTNLLVKYGFKHSQFKNTLEVKNPYPIKFTIKKLSFSDEPFDSVLVFWSIDNFKTTNMAIAKLTDKDKGDYTALIPPQKAGSIVSYYMHIWEPLSKAPVNFYKKEKNPYFFLVGFQTMFSENFENAQWTVGSSADKATQGQWENAVPGLIDVSVYGMGIMQPGEDHSKDNDKCWVTGAKGTSNISFDNLQKLVPNGTTSLTSPDYDISNYTQPVISFYKWFFNYYAFDRPGAENHWLTKLSFDGGNTWKTCEDIIKPTNGWEETVINLKKYMDGNAKKFRLRLIIKIPEGFQFSITKALFDDFEILDIDKSLVGVTENTDKNLLVEVFPNPFTDEIRFSVVCPGNINLDIFDILGQKVKSFNVYSDGEYIFTWDAHDFHGQKLSAGIYFYRITTGDKSFTGKIVLD